MHNTTAPMPNAPFRFVRVSGNSKTGPIPVSSTAAQSCPDACPMKTTAQGGCYAAAGRSAIHWRELTEGRAKSAYTAEQLFGAVQALPKGQLWRHNESGDLMGDSEGFINQSFIKGLTQANKGRRGFTYTHHAIDAGHVVGITNADTIRQANAGGFTVNVSTNNLEHADRVLDSFAGWFPVVTLVNAESWSANNTTKTPQGRTVVRCPAEYIEGITCSTCGLCQVATRKGIVGFTPHGITKKRVIAIAKG